MTAFQEALRSSALCTANDDGDVDVEQLATLYNDVINDIADRLVPIKTVTRRSRPSSDLWYDDACRQACRQCRRAERQAARVLVMETFRKLSQVESFRKVSGNFPEILKQLSMRH